MGEQKEERSKAGFTIIEVMIVLAVMGAMFLGAVLLVAGRQNKTEFTQAAEQVQSQIQQTIDDVINGYYPNESNFKCTASSGVPDFNSGNNGQGTNSGCVFLGKVIQFAPLITPTPVNQQFYVYSIAGGQCNSSGTCDVGQNDLSSGVPTSANPKVIRGPNFDDTDTETLDNGLNVTSMSYVPSSGGSPITAYAIGFLQSLASYSSTGSSLLSGAQQVTPWAINGASGVRAGQDESDAIAAINDSSYWQLASEINICFDSGTTTQSALVTIGGDGRQLSVTMKNYSVLGCGL